MVWGVLAFIITLILVVGIHEAGHAIAARIFSVKIQRIFIGFGRPLFTWRTKSGYELGWGILPLGGYVHLLNSRTQTVSPEELKYCFDKKPVWMRISILIAGALANLITALLAFTIMFSIGYREIPPIIQSIVPTSVAAEAGLNAGDRIVALDGREIHSWQEAGMRVIMSLGKKNVLVVVSNREGVLRNTTIDLSRWYYQKQDSSLLKGLGIVPDPSTHAIQIKREPLGYAFYHAVTKSMQLLIFFLVMIKQLLTGVLPFAVLLGPIGLLEVSTTSFLQGLAVFLSFIASFSLAVGLVNLFPIPGLDGGSIVYALIEKVRGQPVSVEMEILLHRLFVIAFLVLLVQLLLNDAQRYFT
ncbi:membrane associated zinc metalloprotease [Legionella lansingensis]|uniref:Membrane associated zinc metalloprotease n=1 Tax=Legionella lansingensis TaxID=45067 RepID=A0A0W0VN18_9GAMM|nr:site-2 protease family protein [Legionella lansingensis]KTD21521.1 membrane associated zinc metalloprotease [Legionella lansingensis]SNV52569.1 membrane associated zinc metalloprotease [Legionella lansingensis]